MSAWERGRNPFLTVAIALLALALFDTPAVYPLKLFVVFLHELSHGLAAVATGGSIVRIELTTNEAGLCVTRGGSRVLILNAGYLGSLVWGAALLVLGARTRLDRPLVAGLGLVTLTVTLLYLRSPFGFVYGLVSGAALLGVALWLPGFVSDALLRVVGTVSCLYAVWDIASDGLLRDISGSDAHVLGELTGIPGALWATVWVLGSTAVTVVALWLAAAGASGSAAPPHGSSAGIRRSE